MKNPPRTIKELRKRLPKGWWTYWRESEEATLFDDGTHEWKYQLLLGNGMWGTHGVSAQSGKDPACYPAALALAEAVEESEQEEPK